MTDEPRRPSRSDAKPTYRRVYCQKCNSVTLHKLDLDALTPYLWVCQNGCGMSFVQNPWVTESHLLIKEPIRYHKGERLCQPIDQNNSQQNVPTAKEQEPVLAVKATTNVAIATELAVNGVTLPESASTVKMAPAQIAMEQASFL